MKKISLLFISLFILGLFPITNLVAATIYSAGTHTSGTVSNAGVPTGGGLWTATTTWAGGVVPLSTDDVVIVANDLVYNSASLSVAGSLTLSSGAKFSQGASVSSTGSGTFTLAANSWWYTNYSSASKVPQGFGSYSIDPASNWVMCTNGSSSLVQGAEGTNTYGNVIVYKTGAVLAAANTFTSINIQGDFTIKFASASTLKLTNNKSAQNTTIHVGGSIYIIFGTLVGVDVAADWTSVDNTGQTCILNVDHSVNVGDNSTVAGSAGLANVGSADGGLKRSSTFNIHGDLIYINGAKFQPATNNTSTRTDELGIINLYGNLSTDASVTIAANTLGSFQVNFVGTDTKTITLGAPTTQMLFSCTTTLGINKTGGANVQLLSPVTIGGKVTLTLTSGKLITTNTFLPTISGTGAITAGSSSSFVSGPLGYLNISTSPKSFVYPIGKGSAFRPLTLSLTQNDITPSVYTAEQIEGNANLLSNTLPGDLSHVSSVRYFNVSELGGGTTFTAGAVTLSYDVDDQVTDIANLRVAKDGTGAWANEGGTGTFITTGTILSTVPFTSLSNFTLANFIPGGTNPLPVELSSFTANNNGRSIQLNWSTKTEKNSDRFDIQRSLVGNLNWAVVGSVKAAVLSNSPKSYSYSDNKLQSGKYQYRLKMVDNDGSFAYSSVEAAEVAVPKDFSVSQNYPNPFNPSTTIAYQVPVDAKVILEVYNIAGQKVADLVNQDMAAGYYSVSFGASKLSSGVYIYRVVAIDKASGNNFSSVKKMMLLK
jgi:hypothetical protein